MLMYNTTDVEQSIKAFGNWFNWKPGQIRNIQDNFGQFIHTDKKEYGVVSLPEEFEDSTFKDTEQGQAILMEKRIEGRSNRVRHIQRIIHNETVSLRVDLEKAGQKINPDLLMTPEVAKLYDELAAYKKEKDDAQRELMNKVQNIRKKLNE